MCAMAQSTPGHQGSAYGLRRIPIPGTSVNKGKKKGAGPLRPRPFQPSTPSGSKGNRYPLGKGASCSSKKVSKNFPCAGGRDL